MNFLKSSSVNRPGWRREGERGRQGGRDGGRKRRREEEREKYGGRERGSKKIPIIHSYHIPIHSGGDVRLIISYRCDVQ